MKRFQKWSSLALAAALALSPVLSARAYKADTLRSGSRGEAVKQMQQALISLGYLKGSADGKFGAQTRQAVIDFQKANRLTADGLAGKKTLTLLENGKGN